MVRFEITGLAVYAAAAAKLLQLCLTLCDPIDGSLPGSPVPGILQARNWSGLPFPSPMHESEKRKWSRSVMSNSQQPHGLQPTRLLHPWDFPGKSTGVGCHCLLRLFTAALFIISRTWKQPGCPATDKWIKKLWYIYTMEYYSAIKRNTFESVLMRWMNLEPILQSEVSQKEKDKHCILTHIYGIYKNGTE